MTTSISIHEHRWQPSRLLVKQSMVADICTLCGSVRERRWQPPIPPSFNAKRDLAELRAVLERKDGR